MQIATLLGLFHILGERSEHKTIATLLRKESPRDSLMGRGYLSDRASGCERLHPFPWRGEGPWVGVEAFPYEGKVGWVGTSKPEAWLSKKKGLGLLEHPSFILSAQKNTTQHERLGGDETDCNM